MHPGLLYNKDFLTFMGKDVGELAKRFSTPLYVYSAELIQKSIQQLQKELQDIPHLICYSVKANSNLTILELVAKANCGVDIVSGGELHRACKAKVNPKRIVFSGMGKTQEELASALEANILLFSVESERELHWLNAIAQKMNKKASVSLRVNPCVEANTHPYITTGREHDKFGIPSSEILASYERAQRLENIDICGLGFHIGSQIMDTTVFANAAKILAQIASQLHKKGMSLKYINVGGGLGIRYQETEEPPSVKTYIQKLIRELPLKGVTKGVTIILEPGRFIIGNAGILITKILFQKNMHGKIFYVSDAAMNDLIRPSLYQAYHEILSYKQMTTKENWPLGDLVGPICESGDFLARDRKLPPFSSDDYAVLTSCGAYGFVMSSNYNSRRRVAEILINKEKIQLIRKRESYDDLTHLEM